MREECSTAQGVRRPDGHPARGYAGADSIEQNSYEPRPAGWEGAERLTARRSAFFDGSTAVFFLGRQKDCARRRVPEATDAKRGLLAGG